MYKRQPFIATLDDGTTVEADNVVVAVGFKYFVNLPPEYLSLIHISEPTRPY